MLEGPLREVVETALGRVERDDPVLPVTGGPAGNARLTAWTGLVLLVLFIAECVTLLALRQLISWHIVLGTILVPLALAKTASTSWRVVRYYTGDAAYRQAGPPPIVLRLLGPLVVVTALGVLVTGLTLIAVGRSERSLLTIAGQSISPLTLHKVAFVLWLVVVGVHGLARLVPALRLVSGRVTGGRVPGLRSRAALMLLMLAIGVGGGFAVLHYSTSWTSDRGGLFEGGDDGR